MPVQDDAQLGINSWFEEELREQYHHDRSSIDESWKHLFEGNGGNGQNGGNKSGGNGAHTSKPLAPAIRVAPVALETTAIEAGPGEELIPLRGAAARIAENMTASLSMPLATSQRTIPVKVVDENRRLMNHHRGLIGKGKISFTHLIGWALVKALKANPTINHAYAESNGEPLRIVRNQINLGIAIDVAGKSGARNLMVPSIKNAGSLTFSGFVSAFDDLVVRARNNKLGPADFSGTTLSLTNPGTVGTMASIPRLMMGQGAIVAVGAMDFSPDFRGVAPETQSALGISKVMTITCTYDHRIIQGAESGAFLGSLQALLDGDQNFYSEVFQSLGIPYKPIKWETDHLRGLNSPGGNLTVDATKQAAVLQLINSYRVRGHLMADLDPLGSKEPLYHSELDPLTYGLTIWDLDREFATGNLSPNPIATLREILDQLRSTYCGKIGCEYMNIQHTEQKKWLQDHMEPLANNWPIPRELQVRTLQELLNGEEFEHFLGNRFVGQKRFSLEGGETALPILEELLNLAAAANVHEVVVGMAHRGRLNVLANVVGKPLHEIFGEFEGNIDPHTTQGSGDVKYHLGASGVRTTASGKQITVTLASNPSHLEAVDPVVEGLVRPKQDRLGDTARARVIPLLIHGDAAFAGQGIVAEVLNFSQLDGYSTGGTIHLIINNQIGFTTLPDFSRSTPYSTDVARMVQAPIFHVNGDDPEAAMRVVQMAFDFRQQFKKDVVIDMFCYRRHGHNEGDDPAYTQPILYRKIKDQPSVAVLYSERLVRTKVLTTAEAAQLRKKAGERYSTAFDAGKPPTKPVPVAPVESVRPNTTIDRALIEKVVDGITSFPSEFTVHPKLTSFNDKRREALAKNTYMDWAYAEALAFGSLVLEGTPVRLSGQDSGRGTFSQRHLAFYDYETGEKYIPLKHLSPTQARFDVFDSSLSEYGVLGFEFGYSLADPSSLVLWEAQFGDFSNGAQIMIDQFITSSESKWGVTSGLVMLLPHGYEGQGPEHSSARIERFLELAACENMRVANCTTPAQYFHILRRQMKDPVRKPLVIFTPKSLLRTAHSTFDELSSGEFREIIEDTVDPAPVKRIVFCSGKVYYDLLAAREKQHANHVAIVRVEQIYPFAYDQVRDAVRRYAADADLVWVQEEPRNMGPWRFVSTRFPRAIRYIGRPENPSPATGSKKRHDQEQADLVREALS
jgi:multifunctional 2-oxoglutarate metabolism enzyme